MSDLAIPILTLSLIIALVAIDRFRTNVTAGYRGMDRAPQSELEG